MTIPVHWMANRGPRSAWCRLLCALAMLMITVGAVRAQSPGVPGKQVFYSSIGPLTETIARYQTDPRPKSTEGAFQVADWLLYGGLGVGAACDYNLNSSSTNQQQACGPQFTPSIIAAHNTGIQRTLLYGVGDIRYYPTLSRVDLLDTTAGIVHVWEIQRDLIFRVQAQGTRSQDYSGFAGNLASTNVYLTTPSKYTQGYGSTSI